MSAQRELDRNAPVINDTATPHYCFGCGTLNEFGLQLRFRQLPDGGVWAEHTPSHRFEGYLGMVHGGVLTAMLDEAMSWAITSTGGFAVTARINTAFRKPARVGSPLRVEGRVQGTRRRLIDAVATIVDVESSSVVAEAEAVFMRVTEEQAAAWHVAYGAAERVAGGDG